MLLLSPASNEFEVPRPRTTASEFEVQAFLWWRLRELGETVRGEVKYYPSGKRGVCRFDLVVYDGEKATHIIEVKSAPVKHRNGVEATRQGHRYVQFGVPVTFVYGMRDAEHFLEEWASA